ncbi:MAG: chromosomal replication initiator DnaA [Pseudooceanicola sp.]|nr:chromosomal replication initiator DnaA [Pseudooceanicola sp.]
MSEPLPMDHPRLPGLSRDDFVVAPSNAVALAMLDSWRDWPRGKLVLTGPSGSGKTHLAHIWAAEVGARVLDAHDLTSEDVPALAAAPLALDDVDAALPPATEEALFHLHNLIHANAQPLLLTGKRSVATWPLRLPDLRSRVQGAQSAVLKAPDDVLLSALLVKLFAERQLQVASTVIEYLIKRMDRSFDAAGRIVAALDRASLAERRTITVRLAGEVLDKFPTETS